MAQGSVRGWKVIGTGSRGTVGEWGRVVLGAGDEWPRAVLGAGDEWDMRRKA